MVHNSHLRKDTAYEGKGGTGRGSQNSKPPTHDTTLRLILNVTETSQKEE